MTRKIDVIRQRAKQLGIPNWNTIQASDRNGKRASIITPKGKIVHFGIYPYKTGTFIDHNDLKLRDNWRSRHSMIKTGDGKYAYMNPEQPSYYAYNLLW